MFQISKSLIANCKNHNHPMTDNMNLKAGPENGSALISTLIINAAVNVVLLSSERAKLEMSGDKSFAELVTLDTTGSTLTIGSRVKGAFLNTGMIYVPAGQLETIKVNDNAHVETLHSLQVPKLDIYINGSCTLEISSIGQVNVMESNAFYFERTTELRGLPVNSINK